MSTATEVIKFTTTDDLWGTLESELKSFNLSNLLEPSDFYSWVAYVNHNLGLECNVLERAVMKVKNQRLAAPSSMTYIEAMWQLSDPHFNGIRPGHYLQDLHLYTQQTKETHCIPRCCIETHQQKVTVETRKYAVVSENQHLQNNWYYDKKRLLRFANGFTEVTHPESPNLKISPTEDGVVSYDPKRKTFWFSFREGYVLLEYWAIPIDDATKMPLIIDNPNVQQAIEFYCTYRTLRKAYNNGYGDVERRMINAKVEWETAMQLAQYELALPTFQSMVDEIRFVRQSSINNDLTSGRQIKVIQS